MMIYKKPSIGIYIGIVAIFYYAFCIINMAHAQIPPSAWDVVVLVVVLA